MNYNVFTKSELIEAITKDETNSWNIDIELLEILDRKVRAAHEQMNEINNNMIIALKEKDISKFCKLGKELDILDKKYKDFIKLRLCRKGRCYEYYRLLEAT